MKTIYVGNLGLSATPESIKSLIEAYGSVESIRLLSGRCNSVAIVKMNRSASEEVMRALHGHSREGRTLRVKYGRPRLAPKSPSRL